MPTSREGSEGKPGTAAPQRALWRTAVGLVLLATALVFSPIVRNGFVNFDDPRFLVDNPVVRQFGWPGVREAFAEQILSPHYKPFVYLSWQVENRLFGMKPIVFHLDNLLLHLLNSTLVFYAALAVFRIAGFPPRKTTFAAFFTSLLFAVHPLHVESVAWAVQRKDVLFSAFFLGALLCYLRYARSGFVKPRWLGASCLCYLGGVLSKGAALTFVIVPFLIDDLAQRRVDARQLREKLAFAVIALLAAALYGLPPSLGQAQAGRGETLSASLGAQLVRVWAFAAHVAAPFHLSVIYPESLFVSVPGGILAAVAAASLFVALWVFRDRARSRVSGFGVLFFLVTISPVLSMSGRGTNFLSDRYVYLPSLGLILLLVGLLCRGDMVTRRFRQVGSLLTIVAVVWGGLTFSRVRVWTDSETLWSDVIAKFPGRVGEAHLNRGTFRFEAGRLEEALADFHAAILINPRLPKAFSNRGALRARRRELDAALQDFDRALELDRYLWPAALQRAMVLTLQGQFDQAEQEYDRYLSALAGDARGYFWRGLNRQATGLHERAIEDFSRAIDLEPGHRKAMLARAESYRMLGRPVE
ncbi:MAG: tetratricopeptide repeat protein [bacterium]|nr:tetratricopeptide repeat protein [bacterium]